MSIMNHDTEHMLYHASLILIVFCGFFACLVMANNKSIDEFNIKCQQAGGTVVRFSDLGGRHRDVKCLGPEISVLGASL